MPIQSLSITERVTVFSWYYIKKFFGHTYPKLSGCNDEGFEEQFRDYIFRELRPLVVSDKRDLGFGLGLKTISGLQHEIDLVASWADLVVVFELKNCIIDKAMVMVFHQKCLDFIVANPDLLSQKTIERVFLTNSSVLDPRIRAFCNLWGIRLVDLSRAPISQCRLWLERLASHSECERSDSSAIVDALYSDLQYIDDNLHTPMNHLVSINPQGKIDLAPNLIAKAETFVALEESTIRAVTDLARIKKT